ncbi:hypothetical protein [Nocardia salmonicida]|uniref:hypothetical protein n=1 Tax=Nocardia salmonicida TaxID=53431 RepID=UPI0033C54688
MDPMILASALAAGVAAPSTGVVDGSNDGAKLAVTDGFLEAVTSLKCSTATIDVVGMRPRVSAHQYVLHSRLTDASTAELAAAAYRRWLEFHQYMPQAAETVDLRLMRLKAGEPEIDKFELHSD